MEGSDKSTIPGRGTTLVSRSTVAATQISTSREKEEDPNKVLLKALITQQNKTAAEGGISTLKPMVMNRLLTNEGNTMAEWLANLNKQEEGESELACYGLFGKKMQVKGGGKVKSGMLDKATTNIQQKQVWPQQNLGEDWADEEVEFKQMKFEHLVAGETRTIETCSEPAEILGRLRLLQRIAYVKLRGYDWNLIRKMLRSHTHLYRDKRVLMGIELQQV